MFLFVKNVCSKFMRIECNSDVIYKGKCSYESISHLTMRDKVEAFIFKLLALDIDVRTPPYLS